MKRADWLYDLTADCPRKNSPGLSDLCAARCPDLPRVLWPAPEQRPHRHPNRTATVTAANGVPEWAQRGDGWSSAAGIPDPIFAAECCRSVTLSGSHMG